MKKGLDHLNPVHIIAALVWLINGLYCKVLNQVPRHQEIVSGILETDAASIITPIIGTAEIGMSIWIISGIYRRFNVAVQIVVVSVMNALEFFLVPELLLWGKWNSFFALMFILILYVNEFGTSRKLNQPVC